MEARLARVRAKEKAQKEKFLKGGPDPKRRRMENKEKNEGKDEEQFALDDYDSDQEGDGSLPKGGAANGLSAETLTLMKKLGMNIGPPKEEEGELEDEIKVFKLFLTT
jgi:chromosome transmission fidelity protein 1